MSPALAVGSFAGPDGAPFPGLVLGDTVIDLRAHLGTGVSGTTLLHEWDDSLERLRALSAAETPSDHRLADLRPCIPFQPRQMFCAGANYRRHVIEMATAGISAGHPELSREQVREIAEGEAEQLAAGDPFLFAGLPSALSAAEDDIVLRGGERQHDWELELAVVIGRGGRDIPLASAMDHVAGYTIVNDITTRDVISRAPMPYSDLLSGKSRPTYFPTGPYVVPRDAIPDPRRLRLRLSVNGEVMQDAGTADLIHGVDALVAYASRLSGLYAGDLILTGSPSGNAAHHDNRWLRAGDVIEAEITGLGRQRNRCVVDPG